MLDATPIRCPDKPLCTCVNAYDFNWNVYYIQINSGLIVGLPVLAIQLLTVDSVSCTTTTTCVTASKII